MMEVEGFFCFLFFYHLINSPAAFLGVQQCLKRVDDSNLLPNISAYKPDSLITVTLRL